MARVRVQVAASLRLDAIYRCMRDQWGDDQAERYLVSLPLLTALRVVLFNHSGSVPWLRSCR